MICDTTPAEGQTSWMKLQSCDRKIEKFVVVTTSGSSSARTH